jgi:penicillin amidase
VTHTVRHSRHGPVISDVVPAAERLAAADQAVALAWPALRADDRTPDAIRRVNAAASVDDAMAAMDLAGSPHQNLFLADSEGQIGVIAAARVPIRKQGDGTLPRPGWTGAYDWTGTIPFAELPRARDPAEGRLINANNRLVGPDYPHLIAAHWPPPWRAERIGALLDRAEAPVGAETLERILLDTRSPKADLLLDTLLSYPPQTRRQEAAHELLRGWDRRMTRAGRAPLVFTAWLDHLNRALFKDELGTSFRSFARPDPRLIRRALTDRPDWCDDVTTADAQESCAGQVTGALAAALETLRERFGEAENWRWGRAHVARFPHPLLSRIPGLGGLVAPEIATPGGDETVNRGGAHYAGLAAQRYAHIHGATLRMVHDLSRPPSSTRVMLSDGQSGNPLSPHFGGLTEAWRDGKSLKLVGPGQDAGQTLRLTPGKR